MSSVYLIYLDVANFEFLFLFFSQQKQQQIFNVRSRTKTMSCRGHKTTFWTIFFVAKVNLLQMFDSKCLGYIRNSRNYVMSKYQVYWVTWWKSFFQPSKCSLLGQKSNIAKSQFLKIWFFDHFWANSNYGRDVTTYNAKNREIRPQDLDLGGSTASNWRFSITVLIICPKMIKKSDF